jgi:hypothetical protein
MMNNSNLLANLVVEERHNRLREEAAQQRLAKLAARPRRGIFEALRCQIKTFIARLNVPPLADKTPCATAQTWN